MASLEVARTRRKAITYGKANKRLPLHDIFDISPESRFKTTTSSLSARKLLDTSVQASESAEDGSEFSTASSPQSLSYNQSHNLVPSLFDIATSEEESRTHDNSRSAQKRRRLTPVEKSNTLTNNIKSNRVRGQRHVLHRHEQSEAQTSEETCEDRRNQTIPDHPKAKSQLKTFSRAKPCSHRSKLEKALRSPTDTSTAEEESLSSRPVTPATANSPTSLAHPGQLISSIEDSDLSERVSQAAQEMLRKRRSLRAKDMAEEAAPSPSQLGLKSLRLTPDRSGAAIEDTMGAMTVCATQLTPRRGRPRLIDRLDSPRNTSQSDGAHSRTKNDMHAHTICPIECGSEHPTDLGREPSPPQKDSDCQKRRRNRQNLDAMPPVQAQNLTRTYAQERSHLSDMVREDTDVQMITAPQNSAIQPSSQDSTYSSHRFRVELEDSDTDDQAQSGNVRSIHELRQAGANNRFERELETLLDDIDPKSSPSKGLRLQALMQLIPKLKEESFARKFVDVGIASRLTTMMDAQIDVLSAALVAFAFASIGQIEKSNVGLLRQILKSITGLSTLALCEERSFAKVAKDRKHNLSKSLARETAAFEATMLSDPMWDDHQPVSLTPQMIFLHTMAIILLSLRRLGESNRAMSVTMFHELLSILSNRSQQITEDQENDDNLLIIEIVISIFERSQPPHDILGEEEDSKYVLLGHSLTRILDYAAQKNEGLEQAVLRVVVKLSNNKSGLSRALASSTVTGAALHVVKDNFINLAKSADEGEDLDRPKLDCVMLALGCLLNFVDCSPKAWINMIETSSASLHPMDWLVAIFNERVGRAADATTIDQSQVLVAFGYLAMLLCSLCTYDNVRPYVIQRLNGQSLKELCLAGEVFFIHLKEIDINPNDGAMSAFTEHFGKILAVIESYATD